MSDFLQMRWTLLTLLCISWVELWYSLPSWSFYWLSQCAWWTRETSANVQVTGTVFIKSFCIHWRWFWYKELFLCFTTESQSVSASTTTNAEVNVVFMYLTPLNNYSDTFNILTVCYFVKFFHVLHCDSSIFCYQGNQDADSLHYAALRDYKDNRSRRHRDNITSECVYSSVRQ